VDLLPDVDEDALLDDVVMLPWAAMEKELVVERTSVMLLKECQLSDKIRHTEA
jgi:hypothetical protein